jgi:uncharacterized protein (TIGR02453 family)
MRSAFPGFPPEAMEFFRGLARHNNREWFQPRKAIFEERVKQPMRELTEAVNAALARFAPEHVNDPDKAIYRFYRDTRFSADKTPYKDHIAAIFPRRGLAKHDGASYYFSVSSKAVEIAGGVYMPMPETLAALRRHVAEKHEDLRRICRAAALRKQLGELQGNQLARVPKGFAATDPAADLLRYKQFYFFAELPGDAALTPAVTDEIVRRFKAVASFVDFMNAPLVAELKKARFRL